MITSSGKLAHGGANIPDRPTVEAEVRTLRSALATHSLIAPSLDAQFSLLDQIQFISSCGLTIDRTGQVNGLAFTWYPVQSDYRLTRIIYGKAAENTGSSKTLSAINSLLQQYDAAKLDAYIAFGYEPSYPDNCFLKAYIDTSELVDGMHEKLAEHIDTLVHLGNSGVDHQRQSLLLSPAYNQIKQETICDLLGVNISAVKSETKIYRMNYDGINSNLLASDLFSDRPGQQEMLENVERFAALGYKIAYVVFTASGNLDDIRIQFFNPDGPASHQIIAKMIDAGLIEASDNYLNLMKCLRPSLFQTWHVVTGYCPNRNGKIKIYADLPH